MPRLLFTPTAHAQLKMLYTSEAYAKVLKAVLKSLALMEINLRHPSLHTHEYKSIKGPHGEKVFEAYVQQHTPGAYRIFWCYGPKKDEISILSITPHP